MSGLQVRVGELVPTETSGGALSTSCARRRARPRGAAGSRFPRSREQLQHGFLHIHLQETEKSGRNAKKTLLQTRKPSGEPEWPLSSPHRSLHPAGPRLSSHQARSLRSFLTNCVGFFSSHDIYKWLVKYLCYEPVCLVGLKN